MLKKQEYTEQKVSIVDELNKLILQLEARLKEDSASSEVKPEQRRAINKALASIQEPKKREKILGFPVREDDIVALALYCKERRNDSAYLGDAHIAILDKAPNDEKLSASKTVFFARPTYRDIYKKIDEKVKELETLVFGYFAEKPDQNKQIKPSF